MVLSQRLLQALCFQTFISFRLWPKCCGTLGIVYDVPAYAAKDCLLLKAVTEQVVRSSPTAQGKNFHM